MSRDFRNRKSSTFPSQIQYHIFNRKQWEIYTRLRAVDHIGDMAIFLRHFEDRGAFPYI